MTEIKCIISVWLSFCIGSCLTLNRTDVSVLLSGTKTTGDPVIYSISGDPSEWTPILWASGTVASKTFTGNSESHIFQKIGSSYWSRQLLYSNALKGDIEYIPMVFDSTGQTVTPASVHIYTSKQIGGLTVDWTTHNVYWTDQVYNWIMMAQLETSINYLPIITTGLDKPGGIKIHPGKSYLFWTDYSSSNPKIERSSLLGNDRTVLANTNIVTPVSLDIDYTNENIYWIDSGRQTIERCDFDGNSRVTFKQGSFVSALVGIRVYEDNVYTLASDRLYLMKLSDSSALKMASLIDIENAADIEIFGEVKQPQLTSPCHTSSCSHFCVGSNDNTQHTCACPHGAMLIFGYLCTASGYIADPVYIYTTESSICWYPVWTPDLNAAEISDTCYVSFGQDSLQIYMTHSLSTRTLYFSLGASLYVVPLRDGGSVQRITTSTKPINAIALDWISNNMYYTDVEGFISVMKTNGQYKQTILEGVTGVAGLVVDPSTGYMYWTCSIISDPYIGRATMSGESLTRLVSTDVRRPEHLALDYLENRLYWTDSLKDVIESVKTDGTGRLTVITVTNSVPYGIAIFQDHIVWTDRTTSTPLLLWAYKDGSGLASNIMKTEDVVDVLLYGEYSQPQDYTNACSSNNAGCEHMCLPKPSGRVCRCPIGYQLEQDDVTCKVPDSAVLYPALIIIDVGQLTILQMSIDTYHVIALPVTELENPVAIAADVEDDLMFWTDVHSYRIYKASLSGKNQQVVKVLTTGSVADGIAVDWKSDRIYYTDTTLNVIASMDYEGNNERTIITQGLDEPRAIAVDVDRSVMYWTDWGLNPNIMKATYEGNNKQTLVASSLGWPNGLAIDTKEEILYWCDGQLGRIESVHTDGTNRRLLVLASNTHFFNIAEFGSDLYVTDWNSQHLQKISKNGGTLTDVGERVLTKAYGIVALDRTATTTLPPTTTTTTTTPPPTTTTTTLPPTTTTTTTTPPPTTTTTLSPSTTTTTTNPTTTTTPTPTTTTTTTTAPPPKTTSTTTPPPTTTTTTTTPPPTITTTTLPPTTTTTTPPPPTTTTTTSTPTMPTTTMTSMKTPSTNTITTTTMPIPSPNPGSSNGGDDTPGQDNTNIIIVAICVVGFIILAVVLSIGIYCCLKKRRTQPATNPASLNTDYLTTKDIATPPLYDDVYKDRPQSSIYQTIDEEYLYPNSIFKGEKVDKDENPYINRRSENIYMLPISGDPNINNRSSENIYMTPIGGGISPPQTEDPDNPVWSQKESNGGYISFK